MKQSQSAGGLLALPLFSPAVDSFEPFFTTYVIRGRKIALVDPGPGVCLPQLLTGLAEAKIKADDIDYILLTHIHIDHAGAVGDLVPYTPGAKVVVHPRGVRHVANPEKLWQASLNALGEIAAKYGKIKPVQDAKLISAEDEMKIDLGGRHLEVIFTLGHAPHHISFWDSERGELFVGDAVGVYHPEADVLTPGTPPPFDLSKALESLEKLALLEPKVICYSHGGSVPSSIRTLERCRKQLLIWGEVISIMFREKQEDILKSLFNEDEELKRLMKVKKSDFRKETMLFDNSVEGFVEYFKNKD